MLGNLDTNYYKPEIERVSFGACDFFITASYPYTTIFPTILPLPLDMSCIKGTGLMESGSGGVGIIGIKRNMCHLCS